jgi:hypothetical protein
MDGCVVCKLPDLTLNGFYLCSACELLACPEETFMQPDLFLLPEPEQLEYQLERNLFPPKSILLQGTARIEYFPFKKLQNEIRLVASLSSSL